MKKTITWILLLGAMWIFFNNSNTFNFNNFSLFAAQKEMDNETNEAFEQTTIINTSGDYVVLEDGETVRLSGIGKVLENGNKFIYNSLLNREVWIYRDGVDESEISCVYVFISKPGRVLKIEDSFNRILVSKCVATSGGVSNGNYSTALSVYPVFPANN